MPLSNKQLEKFLRDFFGGEAEDFLRWSFSLSPLRPSIRVNTLKAEVDDVKERLEEQGFVLSPVEGIPFAFRVEFYPFEIGRTLEHYLGYIYVQEVSSMLPPIILNPQPGERVLDISAAPGSKTTLLSQLMMNRGMVVANDVDVGRTSALASNVDRLGCVNVIITQYDGSLFGEKYPDYFDRVLVDAPCSAIGTIYKNKEVAKWWSWKNVQKLVRVQRRLIESGFKALKPGGRMVYSTCTITPQENEEVVDFLLNKYPDARVVDFLLQFEHRPDSKGYGKLIWYGDMEPFYISLIEKDLRE